MPPAPRPHDDDLPPQPDPARGVGTTLLVAGGGPHDLEAHLDRLARSADELFGVAPDAGLPGELRRLGAAGARVRVTVRPDGTTRVTSQPFDPPPPGGPVRLVPFTLPGGLGSHSWADRRLADALAARAGSGARALLLDADGSVLEAVGATVLVVEDGRLVAPPLDGRRLPGVTEARLPVAARERLDLGRLAAATSIVLASSLGGVQPAVL